MINVALIDDHIVVRSGFAQLLMLEPDINIVGEYANGQEAWPYLLNDNIDVAVMDLYAWREWPTITKSIKTKTP